MTETLEERVGGGSAADELDGDALAELVVGPPRLVDSAHAAEADEPFDPVGTDAPAGLQVVDREQLGGEGGEGGVEDATGVAGFEIEEGGDLVAEVEVGGAGLVQVGFTVGLDDVES